MDEKRESYHDYMMRRMREHSQQQKQKEITLFQAAKHVADYALQYLRDNKDKMHLEDIESLENSVKVIDAYGFKNDSKNN
jgi:hypothetical protein